MSTESGPSPRAADAERVARILSGDEPAFAELVEELHPALLRQARLFLRSEAVAEEVVQDTWLAVLQGLERFEGRSSLRTWILRIVSNQARTRATREGRTVPFSSIAEAADREVSEIAPAVLADRFNARGSWIEPPRPWQEHGAEAGALSAEAIAVVMEVLDELPPAQRAVLTLRDVEGWSSAEVCNALEIRETNQRVLLHRGRSRVRRALEERLGPRAGG